MTFSYDETNLGVELNKIRLYIGDMDEDNPLLQDEEIISVQADVSGFKATVAACCRLICAQLARRVDYKLSLLSEKASTLYDRYKALAERYEAMGSVSYPWSGSIFRADKEAVEDDITLVEPLFKRGVHKHPGTVDENDNNL